MYYIRLENGLPKEVSDQPHARDVAVYADLRKTKLLKATGWISTRDFTSFEEAITMSRYLTAMTADVWLPVDEGSTYPRFRVIKAPAVGDDVSRGFNGDYYPCGKITKITPTYQIETSDGSKFRRYKQTGGWRETGRGFWMVGGIVDERNPSF